MMGISQYPRTVAKRTQLLLLYTIPFLLFPNMQVASDVDASTTNQRMATKRQDLIPYPRVGRSAGSVQDVLLRLQEQAILVGGPRAGRDPPHGKPPEKHNEIPPLGPASEYMLPYLRPGRSENTKEEDKDNSDQDLENVETMIPTFRMGKRNTLGDRIATYRNFSTVDPSLWSFLAEDSEYITPYPRMGRSFGGDTRLMFRGELKRDTDTQIPTMRMGRDTETDTMVPTIRLGRRNGVLRFEDLLTPYPRIGKRPWDSTMPYPKAAHTNEDGSMSKEYLEFLKFLESSGSITPYPRMGKRMVNQHSVSKRSTRSIDSVYEFSRHNRNNKPQDDDRKGQSKHIPSHIVYSSDPSYLLPYMRPGRSQGNELEDEMWTLIPYLRTG